MKYCVWRITDKEICGKSNAPVNLLTLIRLISKLDGVVLTSQRNESSGLTYCVVGSRESILTLREIPAYSGLGEIEDTDHPPAMTKDQVLSFIQERFCTSHNGGRSDEEV